MRSIEEGRVTSMEYSRCRKTVKKGAKKKKNESIVNIKKLEK